MFINPNCLSIQIVCQFKLFINSNCLSIQSVYQFKLFVNSNCLSIQIVYQFKLFINSNCLSIQIVCSLTPFYFLRFSHQLIHLSIHIPNVTSTQRPELQGGQTSDLRDEEEGKGLDLQDQERSELLQVKLRSLKPLQLLGLPLWLFLTAVVGVAATVVVSKTNYD